MNVCVEYEALLDLYVDGELEAEQMIAVADHLDTCPACRAYADAAMAIRAEFPDEESIPLPEGFHERVMAAVHTDAAKAKAKRKRRYSMFAPLAAACLALMVAVNGGAGSRKESAAAAPSAAPPAAQYSLTANEPSAAPAASAPAAAEPAPAMEAPRATADMEMQYTADGVSESDAECMEYALRATVTAAEAKEHLAAFEAMEYEGAPAYELTMQEYAALCEALGREEPQEENGFVLVAIQD